MVNQNDYFLIGQSFQSFGKVPVIKRARGWRLYTQDGKRLVDLWQAGGASVLGHKPVRVTAELKSAAERGLYAPLPTFYEERLYKALKKLFPDKVFRIYKDDFSLNHALIQAGFDIQSFKITIWRPFSGENPVHSEQKNLFIPVLPFPSAPRTLVLDKILQKKFPPSDLVSPVLVACTAQAVNNLAAHPERGAVLYEEIETAIKGGLKWRRAGIYIYSMNSEEDCDRRFELFLRHGFLTSPLKNDPLILPGELSLGEERRLASLLASDDVN
ncbi:MAG: hypothetical protein LBD07_04385 [Spirochaetaceae bacterium]|jgi:hypothetical protein|nr:hypothetical protein [Spirochaetaceae bacterium]